MLEGKTDQQHLPSSEPTTVATGRSRVQKDRKDGSSRCALPAEKVPSEDAWKVPAPVETTACLSVRGPQEECKPQKVDAAHVQGPAPAAEGGENTPPEKSADYRLRKAKAQREYYRRKKEAQIAFRAATPAPPQDASHQGTASPDSPPPDTAPDQKHGGGEPGSQDRRPRSRSVRLPWTPRKRSASLGPRGRRIRSPWSQEWRLRPK